jgi:ATP-dependent RNA helicase DHX36
VRAGGVTHVVLDEIHERDKFADFAIILLLDVLKANPSLRLVLMSATLQTKRFSSFFGGCPVLQVQGRTFPVQEYFLEDVLRLTGAQEQQQQPPVRRCVRA